MIRGVLLAAAAISLAVAADEFKFHPVFGDSMVLQASPSDVPSLASLRSAPQSASSSPAALASAVFGTGCDGAVTVTLGGKAVGVQAKGVGGGAWRVDLPPMPATSVGTTLTARCAAPTSGGAPAITALLDVVFGDVYLTSGQSNMELPTEHTFSYWNASLVDINGGVYFESPSIRVAKIPHTLQLAPTATLDAPLVWSRANHTSLQGHSAISYYFAKELQEQMGAAARPVGILESSWGGTIIESWVDAEAQKSCSYRICGPDAPKGKVCNASSGDSHQIPGSLYNGMIVPVANLTIRSAIWYQGENNGANSNGTFANHTGYACLLPTLVENWRATFSASGGTSPTFPVGVVSLHAWCGEEEANCVSGQPGKATGEMVRTNHVSELRWAQTADSGILPNARMTATFTAMAYDLPDPRVGYEYYVNGKLAPGEKWYNCSVGGSGAFPNPEYATLAECEANPPPLPKPLMGSIHPRNKRLLGARLARAARAEVYGDAAVAFTGPVLSGCSVSPASRTLALQFDADLLRGETIKLNRESSNLTTNLEVRIGAAADGTWVKLPISAVDGVTASAALPAGRPLPTAVRYAFYDNPACPAAYDTFHLPGNKPYWCLDHSTYDVTAPGSGYNAVNMCALYSAPSHLPAVPFVYEISDETCTMAR